MSSTANKFGLTPEPDNNLSFDERKLIYIKSLLKSQVDHLNTMKPYVDVSERAYQDEFNKYTITNEFKGSTKAHSCKTMQKATHKNFNEYTLVCKIYDGMDTSQASSSSQCNFKPSSLYFRILRHLGKKHPNIIQTWEVFLVNGQYYVMQEFAGYGNLKTHLDRIKKASEKAAQYMGKQLILAMDYMGDMGIAHRSICPSHILVCHQDLRVKITGFRFSIIYWNPDKEDINYQPCLSASKRNLKDPEFQALEVYGDPDTEEFDPITADIWSLGASIFFALTGKYPFDITVSFFQCLNKFQQNIIVHLFYRKRIPKLRMRLCTTLTSAK